MGITGFHTSTKHLVQQVHISTLSGKRVAIDASSWIIRGGVAHSRSLYTDPEYAEQPWVDFTISMLSMLQNNGIEPVMVFDGDRLDLKMETSLLRQKRREVARKQALCFERENNIEEAEKKWKQTFEVTQQMVDDVSVACEKKGVECVHALYEADQTMAALVITGDCHGCITEDSDVVAYGVSCCMFKLKQDGLCDLLDTRVDPPLQEEDHRRRKITVRLSQMTRVQTALVCAFSGNDYLKNLPGIGIKKVYALLQHVESFDDAVGILRKTIDIDDTYLDRAQKIFHIFMNPLRYANL